MSWDPNLTGDELLEQADEPDVSEQAGRPDAPDAPAPTDGTTDERLAIGSPVRPAAEPCARPTDEPSDVGDAEEPFVPGGYGRAGWWFMRLSGVVLIVLLLGTVLTLHVLDGGVHRLNWGVVAARWSSPWWRLWDVALIWLGLLHGGLGLRTTIRDYSRHDGTRTALTLLLGIVLVVVAGLATLVIVTFDPGI